MRTIAAQFGTLTIALLVAACSSSSEPTSTDGQNSATDQCDGPPGCSYTLSNDVATTTLECFCAQGFDSGCPATLDEAMQTTLPTLPCLGETDGYAIVDRGCGYVTVGFDGGLWSVLWHYDEATGALVGAERSGDLGEPPCNTHELVGGVVPACDTIDRCTPCSDMASSSDPVPLCD